MLEMNFKDIKNLFEMQRVLDDRIIRDKELDGQELLPNTFLASLVELAECCNDWQGFKHWKMNTNPKPTVLEEYVDKLHFLLSIGNQLDYSKDIYDIVPQIELDITSQFLALFYTTSFLYYNKELPQYLLVLQLFMGLGDMLGFEWIDILNAYQKKNTVNHMRQSNGY